MAEVIEKCLLHLKYVYFSDNNAWIRYRRPILTPPELCVGPLFAMEINVQKDLRTGESQVLSTSTISPQELQQKGIKVYDDGRKSVYALRTDGHQPGANGVDELKAVQSGSENHRGMRLLDCDIRNHSPCSAYSEDSKLSVLNAMPSDEPVTMIFMGYQNAEDDRQSYEGSVRAELVVIGDGEDEASKSLNPHQNSNAFICSAGRKGKRDGTEDPSTSGTPKIKKVKRRHKPCCVLM
uniref:Palmdelphin n=1 Tax=Cyprinus carpio carpio TaxID=630221 RepID=A0A9J7ZZ28_CYPCA